MKRVPRTELPNAGKDDIGMICILDADGNQLALEDTLAEAVEAATNKCLAILAGLGVETVDADGKRRALRIDDLHRREGKWTSDTIEAVRVAPVPGEEDANCFARVREALIDRATGKDPAIAFDMAGVEVDAGLERILVRFDTQWSRMADDPDDGPRDVILDGYAREICARQRGMV